LLVFLVTWLRASSTPASANGRAAFQASERMTTAFSEELMER